MDESHHLRLVQIIRILMVTKTAFSQSPQLIQANGCRNVTYRGTVFNLSNNSPATCFKACGNTTTSVALQFMECACDPNTNSKTSYGTIIAKPCTGNAKTNCGCLIRNTFLWSLYEIDKNALFDIVNNLKIDPSDDIRCISAHKDENTIKYEVEDCDTRHVTMCISVLTRERFISQPHSWQNQTCNNLLQKPVNRSELNSQNLNINSNIWTNVFIEKAQDPNIQSIIYNATLDTSTASLLTPIETTQLRESLQETSLFNSQYSTSAQLEFSKTTETTYLNTEQIVHFDITSSLSDLPINVMHATALIKVSVEPSTEDISGRLFLEHLASFEKHVLSVTEPNSVLSNNVFLTDQESSSLSLTNFRQQTSATHSQTISTSFSTVSEKQFLISKFSLTNINQQVISRNHHLIVEQYTKPPLPEYVHYGHADSLSFTTSSESVASSVINPTNVLGSSSIDRVARLKDQTPKPESLLGTFSDIKVYVIVIMTAVICGMIGVVTALLLINRTLVASQKEMTRMNDLLSRKLRGIDTCDELPLTSVVDDIGTGNMRRLESRPNEYTFSPHNVNDNESRQSSYVGNRDNEMATRTNEFPSFSFSTRSDLRRYERSYSRPFGPMASSD
ncbi:uncharacterized protein LOC127879085 isoform X2 [Dreissena polymorpha]|uniref:WSC domain-containing protein n=3 Tax=Dreissena polymorpha TaxID=45954 RepID=A0A9D4MRA2_DREPO|nr:uncharacterized protein LOC127879085 isoform X2 [Dreissena polymorpha]XP_052281673.1 uncharacterized protein LOC127879085 isoform X2 [Dreissena polymorpha]KAH3881078.1 hypothetical protein DPMN_005002 [Dreissena polymorpha]